ncbi:helix-turn-helix domain-containing protein [Kitasatospora sp. NPDC096147]|uniref:helix-turn-helix domain-containing protein n=1 Tax=Kitasatospora sp. NPDC096147 TaxID=3364093 RepID=UPI00382341B2
MNQRELDGAASPLAAFGMQLRRSRKTKGLSQAELGRLLSCSDSYVSYIERAERQPPPWFAPKADAVLETGGTLELMWWQLQHSMLIEGFPEYAREEAMAKEIRVFELGVIPGLLQTEEYARAHEVEPVRAGDVTQQQADERVAFFLARQAILDRPAAPLVYAVLDEGCLRRWMGGPAVMARQLAHLEQLATRPNVILQIAPSHMADRCLFHSALWLLTMGDRSLLGYTETFQRGYLERDSAKVATWERHYARLQVDALSRDASTRLIRDVRKELEHAC